MADTPEAHMALAGLALSLRNWQAAEAGFNEAAAMDPQLEGAWLMLARLKAAQGDENSAVSYLDKGLARLPQSIALMLERAGGKSRRGNDGKAIDWYRRIVAIDGNQRDALIGLAISALRTGNNGLALDAAALPAATPPMPKLLSWLRSSITRRVTRRRPKTRQRGPG